MGCCLCKKGIHIGSPASTPRSPRWSEPPTDVSICGVDNTFRPYPLQLTPRGMPVKSISDTVDRLVSETLDVLGQVVNNEAEPLSSIITLHSITDKPLGWLELIYSILRVIPLEHSMGPSVIALLIDDSPLPTSEAVLRVADIVTTLRKDSQKERNMCVVLASLAEKLATPTTIALFNNSTIVYLVKNLAEDVNPHVKLHSLIALEKFAQTSENKSTVQKLLDDFDTNPLLELEKYATSKDCLMRQIGFCARWCLDNCFPVSTRKYSYESIDLSNVNAMLNVKDVSDYLKISADGLEARCDTYSFESVRCTFKATAGCWYYEVLLVTPGVMQIGWATKDSSFQNDDGYGIGDDVHSIGFDGCRNLIWHNAKSIPVNLPSWKSGSILGCLIDVDKEEVVFSLDGKYTTAFRPSFGAKMKGFFAAASFMSYQQCKFNFGSENFVYPPQRDFKCFNAYGTLTTQDKLIVPRHVYLKSISNSSVQEMDCCTLCYDKKAVIQLDPCSHKGFCLNCSKQLKFCPLCRVEIKGRLKTCTEIGESDTERDNYDEVDGMEVPNTTINNTNTVTMTDSEAAAGMT